MSKKYLYSNGNYIYVYKQGFKGNQELDSIDWEDITKPLRSGDLIIVKGLRKSHGIPQKLYFDFVKTWKDEIERRKAKKEAVYAEAEMHQNCFAGSDE